MPRSDSSASGFGEIDGGSVCLNRRICRGCRSNRCPDTCRAAPRGEKNEVAPAFVFSHVDFVSNMLERAYAAGDECYQRVSHNLQRSATSGTRFGIPGVPAPQDVALRDQASATLARFIAGTPAHRFYSSLAEYAEASIRDQLARDEEMLD